MNSITTSLDATPSPGAKRPRSPLASASASPEPEPKLRKREPAALPRLPPISSLTRRLPQRAAPEPAVTRSPRPTAALGSTPLSPSSTQSTDDRDAAPSAQVATAGADDLCRYRNKLCLNPRAIKRNGKPHNLCEKHRAKANHNQRKLETKRRLQRHQSPRPPPPSISAFPHRATTPAPAALPPLAQVRPPTSAMPFALARCYDPNSRGPPTSGPEHRGRLEAPRSFQVLSTTRTAAYAPAPTRTQPPPPPSSFPR